jgi:hypothetical protein
MKTYTKIRNINIPTKNIKVLNMKTYFSNKKTEILKKKFKKLKRENLYFSIFKIIYQKVNY